jgi:hypothetical protein
MLLCTLPVCACDTWLPFLALLCLPALQVDVIIDETYNLTDLAQWKEYFKLPATGATGVPAVDAKQVGRRIPGAHPWGGPRMAEHTEGYRMAVLAASFHRLLHAMHGTIIASCSFLCC